MRARARVCVYMCVCTYVIRIYTFMRMRRSFNVRVFIYTRYRNINLELCNECFRAILVRLLLRMWLDESFFSLSLLFIRSHTSKLQEGRGEWREHRRHVSLAFPSIPRPDVKGRTVVSRFASKTSRPAFLKSRRGFQNDRLRKLSLLSLLPRPDPSTLVTRNSTRASSRSVAYSFTGIGFAQNGFSSVI